MNVSMPIAAVMLDLGFPAATAKAVPLLARTASLLAHLAEEQEQPVGFLMAEQGGGGGRVRGAGGGAADAGARGRGAALGRAARARRRGATARRSPTCSSARPSTATKLGAAGFASAGAAGGLGDIGALPLTEKHELKATATAEQPDRRAPLRDAGGDRPHLLHQRHHRHAELHPADRRRPRQLGDRLGAQLRGVGRRRRRPAGLHLQRGAVRGRLGAGVVRPHRPLPHPGRHRQHRAAGQGDRAAASREARC